MTPASPEPLASPAPPEAARAPRRLIGPFDATMLVAGSMIGSGIFIVSAESARQVGSPALLLGVWALAGALTVVASLACAELAVLFPQAGGPYVFLGRAYGPLAGFLYAWGLVTVVQTGTIAAVAVAFARFLGVILPGLDGPREKVVAIALIALLSAANARGLRTGTRIQNVLTVVKVAALAGLTFAGLLLVPAVAPVAARPGLLPPDGFLLALAVAVAMSGPLFSQSAWTNVTFPGAEVRDPARTFPLALATGCLLVAALYVLANVSYLRVLGLGGIATAASDRVGTAAAAALFPGWGERAMAAAILVSTGGCVNGLVLSGARVLWALSRDGLFFRPFGALNGSEVPGRALGLQAFLASLLVLSGTYSELLRYVVAAELVLSVLIVMAVPVLRRREPDLPRPYRTWGYPVTPYLYAIPATVLCGLLTMARPQNAWPGLLLFAAGVPVYLLWKGRTA